MQSQLCWFLHWHQASHGKLKKVLNFCLTCTGNIFFNAIEAAQFLSPVREISRCICVAIQFGEGSDNTTHQNQPISLVRGESDPKGKPGPRALQGELWFLRGPGRAWGAKALIQHYRTRCAGTAHHLSKRNPPFDICGWNITHPLTLWSLILLVKKEYITAHLSQPSDWDSKGLSGREALVKYKLQNDAEALEWSAVARALQMAHCGLLFSERYSLCLLTQPLVLGSCRPAVIAQVLYTNNSIQ